MKKKYYAKDVDNWIKENGSIDTGGLLDIPGFSEADISVVGRSSYLSFFRSDSANHAKVLDI